MLISFVCLCMFYILCIYVCLFLPFFFCFNHGRGVNQFYTHSITRARMHVRTHIRTHIQTHTRICIYKYTHTHTYIYTHIHIYTHTCICRIVVMAKARKLETTPQVCQLRISCFFANHFARVFHVPNAQVHKI